MKFSLTSQWWWLISLAGLLNILHSAEPKGFFRRMVYSKSGHGSLEVKSVVFLINYDLTVHNKGGGYNV